jgi:hypothetical protein
MKNREDLAKGPKEKAIEAIKAGKTEEALKYLNETYEMFRRPHDGYINTINLLMARLFEAKGAEWFESFERNRCSGNKARFSAWARLPVEELMKAFCNIHLAHLSEFHVEEYDDRIVMKITGCNAGGRLLRDGIAVQQNGVTKTAYPWTSGEVGFPYYCAHYYFYNELFRELGIRAEVQWKRQYDDQGKPTGESCKYIAYK